MVGHDLTPQHVTADVPLVRMPGFWAHASTCCSTFFKTSSHVYHEPKLAVGVSIMGQHQLGLHGSAYLDLSQIIKTCCHTHKLGWVPKPPSRYLLRV